MRKILELARGRSLRDYLILATIAVTGVSVGEVVGSRDRTQTLHISKFLTAKTKTERKVRDEIIKLLFASQEGEVEYQGRSFQLSRNKDHVTEILSQNPLPGLQVENVRGGSVFIIEKKGSEKVHLMPAWLYQRFSEFLKDQKKGLIFDITIDMVNILTKQYAKLAGVQGPNQVSTQSLRNFYRDYKGVVFDVLAPGYTALAPTFSEEYVYGLIKTNETEEVEFKVAIPRDHSEFCETMVAFANRKGGGRIILGVDNKGKIVSITEPELADERIRNFGPTYCNPPVTFTSTIVNLKEGPIVIIDVKEGLDKPYWLKDRGPMMRDGSHDRVMTRPEVEQLFRPRFQLPREEANRSHDVGVELATRIYTPIRKEVMEGQDPRRSHFAEWKRLDQEAPYWISRVRETAPDIAELCDEISSLSDDIWPLRMTLEGLIKEECNRLAQEFESNFDKGSKVEFSNFSLALNGASIPFYIPHLWIMRQSTKEYAETLVRESFIKPKTWRLELLVTGQIASNRQARTVAVDEEATAFGNNVVKFLESQEQAQELRDKLERTRKLGEKLLARINEELAKG